jgi:hypothetical protein
MPIKGSINPFTNVLGLGIHTTWKIYRYPFEDSGGEIIGNMKEGYLVKFNATGDAVAGAVATDDAALGGIIVGLPGPEEDEAVAPLTVAVAVQGEFNYNQVHYANAHAVVPPATPAPISPAGVARLRELNIFLDPAIPAGGLQP